MDLSDPQPQEIPSWLHKQIDLYLKKKKFHIKMIFREINSFLNGRKSFQIRLRVKLRKFDLTHFWQKCRESNVCTK